jgi:hypothetical protein
VRKDNKWKKRFQRPSDFRSRLLPFGYYFNRGINLVKSGEIGYYSSVSYYAGKT